VVSIIFFGVGRERRVRKKQRGVAMRKRIATGGLAGLTNLTRHIMAS
jgi:hypothetical protein